MRLAFAFTILPVLVIGCTPDIPVKPDFGTSALVPAGDTPPEFAQFNAYEPAVAALLADQTCATPNEPVEDKAINAAPGGMVLARSRCRTHRPIVGDGDFFPDDVTR